MCLLYLKLTELKLCLLVPTCKHYSVRDQTVLVLVRRVCSLTGRYFAHISSDFV